MVTKVQNVMTPQNTSPRPSNRGRCHQEVKKPCISWISEELEWATGNERCWGFKVNEDTEGNTKPFQKDKHFSAENSETHCAPRLQSLKSTFFSSWSWGDPIALQPSFLSTAGIAVPELVLNFHLNLWHNHRNESTGWKVRLMLSHFYLIGYQWAM